MQLQRQSKRECVGKGKEAFVEIIGSGIDFEAILTPRGPNFESEGDHNAPKRAPNGAMLVPSWRSDRFFRDVDSEHEPELP